MLKNYVGKVINNQAGMGGWRMGSGDRNIPFKSLIMGVAALTIGRRMLKIEDPMLMI
jgi:hypothetical protein